MPKVKFVMYLALHISHLLLLLFTLFFASGDLTNGLSPAVSFPEWCFWGWSILFALAELKEFRSYDAEGLRIYLRSGWNKLDVSSVVLIVVVAVLRIGCTPQATDVPSPPLASPSPPTPPMLEGGGVGRESVPSLADTTEGQCWQEVYSRNLYSVISFMLYVKLLSYAEYAEMIGVHVIIMTQVVLSHIYIHIYIHIRIHIHIHIHIYMCDPSS